MTFSRCIVLLSLLTKRTQGGNIPTHCVIRNNFIMVMKPAKTLPFSTCNENLIVTVILFR